jgi:predicted dehydrogenase
MADRLARVGFIGCGRFATEAIYPALRYAAVDLMAVCSRTADKAERTARQFGARRWYTDYRAILSQEDLDGVFVITGPHSHPDIVCDVLERGRPVQLKDVV